MSVKTILIIACLSLFVAASALAQKRYSLGASDTEIKFWQTMPYSGSLSSYSRIGKVEAAYFSMLNESGGIISFLPNYQEFSNSYSSTWRIYQYIT